jgi:hypothetical protein
VTKSAVGKRTSLQRLYNADDTLRVAMHGLDLLAPRSFEVLDQGSIDAAIAGKMIPLNPELRASIGRELNAGFRIVCLFGAATTLALQALNGTESGFAKWWAPRRQALEQDAASRYVWDCRVRLAHRGASGLYNVVTKQVLSDLDGRKSLSGSVHLELLEVPSGVPAAAHTLCQEYAKNLDQILEDAWTAFGGGTERGFSRPLATSLETEYY